MNPRPNNSCLDCLDWLRDIRHDLFKQRGQDHKRLGNRYRQVQEIEQSKLIDPRKTKIVVAPPNFGK